MPEILIFQIVASLGSMGEFGGHERRGSLDLPGRSAVLGMLGAALGRRRGTDMSDLDALCLAVASFGTGAALRDYQTVQTVRSATVKAPQSRPEALRKAGLLVNTTLTSRDYRADCVFGVALWGGVLGPIAAALRQPVFNLWLGRKACPLSAPFDPQIVSAEDPAQALANLRLPPWIGTRKMSVIAADAGTELGALTWVETRHDRPLDRVRWHFGPRRVTIANPQIRAGGAVP